MFPGCQSISLYSRLVSLSIFSPLPQAVISFHNSWDTKYFYFISTGTSSSCPQSWRRLLKGASVHMSLMRRLHATEWSRVFAAKRKQAHLSASPTFGTTCIWFSPNNTVHSDEHIICWSISNNLQSTATYIWISFGSRGKKARLWTRLFKSGRGWSADMYFLPFLLNAELNKMLCDMAHLRHKCAFSAGEIFSIWRSAS